MRLPLAWERLGPRLGERPDPGGGTDDDPDTGVDESDPKLPDPDPQLPRRPRRWDNGLPEAWEGLDYEDDHTA